MKRIEWDSDFSNNAVVVLSAPRSGEHGVARRLIDDLLQLSATHHPFMVEHIVLKSRQHLVETMFSLARRAKKGLRPIIHLDMHGDPLRGLEIAPSAEFARWDEVFAWLRKVNVRAKNNLGVVGAACYSLSLIRSISIFQPVPFYFLVAPQSVATIGQIDDGMPNFYRNLLCGDGLSSAVDALGPPFSLFHCEKMMTIVLAKYIKHQCKGRSFADRKERLLTAVLQHGLPRTKENLRLLRKGAREQLRPTDDLVQRYADRFLLGRDYNVTLEMLLDLVDRS